MTREPHEGKIVLYKVGSDEMTMPVYRPAMIVRVWPSSVNLQVFLNGESDRALKHPVNKKRLFTADECLRGMAYRTSATEGTEVGTWRWPASAEI